MGKESSPPPAPDYAGAARTQSAGSLQAALANNIMAHPNVNTPLGSQTWKQTGSQTIPGAEGNPSVDIPTYEQNVNLTPQGQGLYNQEMNLSTGLMGLGQGSLDQVKNSLGQPQDMGSVKDIADQSYNAQTSRLDPQWQHNEDMQKTQLANQGLTAGGEGYDNAMRVFNQGKNDAYQQARLGAISTMPQTYQLSTASRMQPLTEFNAIRTGAQPQMPQFQPVSFPGSMQGPNAMGAAQAGGQYAGDVYNAQVGQQNAMMSGLFGLGGAGIGAYGMMNAAPLLVAGSDRKLKSNIVRIGTHPELGIGIYEYDIFGKHDYGVMADEVEKVKPEAVTTHPEYGYKMVYYGML